MSQNAYYKDNEKLFKQLLEEKDLRIESRRQDREGSLKQDLLESRQRNAVALSKDIEDAQAQLDKVESALVDLDRQYETSFLERKHSFDQKKKASGHRDRDQCHITAFRILSDGLHPIKKKGDVYRHLKYVLENEKIDASLQSRWVVYRFTDLAEERRVVELLETYEQQYEVISLDFEALTQRIEAGDQWLEQHIKESGWEFLFSASRQQIARRAYDPALSTLYDEQELITHVASCSEQEAVSEWILILQGDYFFSNQAQQRLYEDILQTRNQDLILYVPISEAADSTALKNNRLVHQPVHDGQWIVRRDALSTYAIPEQRRRLQNSATSAGWLPRLDLPVPINREAQRLVDAELDFLRRFREGRVAVNKPDANDNSMLRPFIFGIPLRSRASTRNWETVCQNLQRTLYNLSRQSVKQFSVIIACHDIPDIKLYDLDVQFLQVDFEPWTEENGKFANDKGKKKRAINMEIAGRTGTGCYYMPLDADDLVAPDLVERTLQTDNRRGYLIEKGYVFDMELQQLVLCDEHSAPFWTHCGSCAIFYLTREDLPVAKGDNQAFINSLRSHVDFPDLARDRGRELEPFATETGVYVMGHGENNRVQYRNVAHNKVEFVEAHKTSDPHVIEQFKYRFPEIFRSNL